MVENKKRWLHQTWGLGPVWLVLEALGATVWLMWVQVAFSPGACSMAGSGIAKRILRLKLQLVSVTGA